jgi:hypothetical protein
VREGIELCSQSIKDGVDFELQDMSRFNGAIDQALERLLGQVLPLPHPRQPMNRYKAKGKT